MSEWNRRDPLNRNPATGRASALRRAIGLGSAKSGTEHWWLQRMTAVALVPLLIWFVASLIAHVGSDYRTVSAWLGWPPVGAIMTALLIAMFWHMMLGLRVIVEDYVHSDRLKFAAIAAVQAGCWALMIVGVFAVFSIAFR